MGLPSDVAFLLARVRSRTSAAALVVEEQLSLLASRRLGELKHLRQQVVVVRARAAMEQEQRPRPRCAVGAPVERDVGTGG